METIIIGISGKKRSGKDTVAKLIANHLDCDILSFATPVKEVTALMMGYEKDEFLSDNCKDKIYTFIDGKTITGRELLQMVGTDCMRNIINETVWITNMNNRILSSKKKYIIIPDVRFDNEYNYIKNNNGIIIRTERTDLKSNDTHISENMLDNYHFDYTIKCKTGEYDIIEENVKNILIYSLNINV